MLPKDNKTTVKIIWGRQTNLIPPPNFYKLLGKTDLRADQIKYLAGKWLEFKAENSGDANFDELEKYFFSTVAIIV